jgi:hypothetical protein
LSAAGRSEKDSASSSRNSTGATRLVQIGFRNLDMRVSESTPVCF